MGTRYKDEKYGIGSSRRDIVGCLGAGSLALNPLK
jgi:hypothetical protein